MVFETGGRASVRAAVPVGTFMSGRKSLTDVWRVLQRQEMLAVVPEFGD
jgi:hypothetical protein